jgi:ribosomal protein S18 acetylase RimI-like enzyme
LIALELRPAAPGDLADCERCSTGPIAGKQSFLSASLAQRSFVTARFGERIVGYIVWDQAFFGRPFVWLLGVDPEFRRLGVGERLMREFEAQNAGRPQFTSTNESNRAMQRLLAKLGFSPSGRIDNIDPGDPELVYFRAIGGEADRR